MSELKLSNTTGRLVQLEREVGLLRQNNLEMNRLAERVDWITEQAKQNADEAQQVSYFTFFGGQFCTNLMIKICCCYPSNFCLFVWRSLTWRWKINSRRRRTWWGIKGSRCCRRGGKRTNCSRRPKSCSLRAAPSYRDSAVTSQCFHVAWFQFVFVPPPKNLYYLKQAQNNKSTYLFRSLCFQSWREPTSRTSESWRPELQSWPSWSERSAGSWTRSARKWRCTAPVCDDHLERRSASNSLVFLMWTGWDLNSAKVFFFFF